MANDEFVMAIEAAEARLKRKGQRAKLPDLSKVLKDLQMLCGRNPGDVQLRDLRLRAQLCEGLRAAWGRRPVWYLCAAAFNSGVADTTDRPDPKSSDNRLLGLLEMNRALVSLFARQSRPAVSNASLVQATVLAERYLGVMTKQGRNPWLARVFIVRSLATAGAKRRNYAMTAKDLLVGVKVKDKENYELLLLTFLLLGHGDGKVPKSGLLRSGYKAKIASLGPHHLYYPRE